LSLNRISELIWDNESYGTRAPSDSSFEEEENFEYKPEVSHLQPDRPRTKGHASSSSFSSNSSDEEEIFKSGQVQTPSPSQWTRLSVSDRSAVREFSGDLRAQKGNEASHINLRLQST